MPKPSQQQTIHCQQADDFTVVTTSEECNKENLSQARNYQTLSQTIAHERLLLLRMVELENSIFTEAFHLIETYYRPTNNSSIDLDIRQNNTSASSAKAQSKRKRRIKSDLKLSPNNDASESHHYLGTVQLPRKRIHGLSKAYKTEFSTKMSLPGISKHFGTFHHDLIDWQLVFAPATDFPYNGNNLAKELNYDSLFDYEDAIAITANLLTIARQHSNLIDGLVLCPTNDVKSAFPEYVRDQTNYGGSAEFQKMIVLVEQLIKHKKNRAEQLRQKAGICDYNPTQHLLTNWFKNEKSQSDTELAGQTLDVSQSIQQIVKEVSAWEELVDVVEISTK